MSRPQHSTGMPLMHLYSRSPLADQKQVQTVCQLLKHTLGRQWGTGAVAGVLELDLVEPAVQVATI